MKIFKKGLVIFAAVLALVFAALQICPIRVTPILMYHKITGGNEPSSAMSVKVENFEKQMKFLARRGYKVISLDELVDEIKEGKKFLPKTVVITFDDGFEDNYVNAFPVLSKYNMPATIFLISNFIARCEGYLDWDQVNVMSKNGIDFGAHTRNEAYLPSVESQDKLLDEIAGSKHDIEQKTQKEVKLFCYTLGAFNEDVKATVIASGYKGACTTNRGSDRFNRDVYQLNRIKATDSDGGKPFHFRAKLSGYYNLFRRLGNNR